MSAAEHDPRCLAAPVDYAISSFASPCICDRLRAARADERERAAERVEALMDPAKKLSRFYLGGIHDAAVAVRHE